MGLAEVCAGVALLGLILYGVLGGADFGGGVWDFFARGPRKQAQRDAIAHAMGPVWEANHVWLIFVIVILFSVFPPVYYAVSVGLYVPFHLVIVGITLRGAAFAFRAHLSYVGDRRPGIWGVIFGASSVITPVLLGMCFGAVSTGALRVDGDRVWNEGSSAAWLSPFAIAMGGGALSLFAYLAAVFLCTETQGELREDFRRRALAAGTVVVAGAALTVPLMYFAARHLWDRFLTVRCLPIALLGVVSALVSGGALLYRRYVLARASAIAQVVFLLVGWALAQYPYLVYPDLTLESARPDPTTMKFILQTLPVGGALLVPSLWLLFRVFKGPKIKPSEAERGE